jgi:hypothetical protein
VLFIFHGTTTTSLSKQTARTEETMSISFDLVAPIDEKASSPISCPLCCEDKPLSAMCLLSRCSHESCKDCITKWIEKTEASGHQRTQPTCPFCRLELTEAETFVILGRSFHPATASSAAPTEVEADELTLQWLQEQTRPCPHCGALIEKGEGCDLMECLCGYRFCYGCGSQGAECPCTPENHVFFDNIARRNADRGAQEGAAVDEDTGFVDLLAHIERRRRQEQAAKVRRERDERRRDEEWERKSAEEDGFTLSAKWLFYASSQKSLRVLQQRMRVVQMHMRARSVKLERMTQRRRRETEQRTMHEFVSSGAWLFRIKSSARVEKILKQNVYACDRRIARRNRRNCRGPDCGVDAAIASGRWLFVKKGYTETQTLLAKLFYNQENRRRCRRGGCRASSLLLVDFFGLTDHFGGCGRSCCPRCGSVLAQARDLEENATNIRLLFLNKEEARRERTEIARNGL